MTRRAAIYLRVSTGGDQTTDNQRQALEAVALRSGWTVVGIYDEVGKSGALGRDKRPEYDRLRRDATLRGFDVVLVWSIDRLGRSLRELLEFMEELNGFGVDLFVHEQALDTTTPSGRIVFQVIGAVAEFERHLIKERVKAGLTRARAEGKQLGRPPKPNPKTPEVLAARRAGQSVRCIAGEVGLSVGAVHKILKANSADLEIIQPE